MSQSESQKELLKRLYLTVWLGAKKQGLSHQLQQTSGGGGNGSVLIKVIKCFRLCFNVKCFSQKKRKKATGGWGCCEHVLTSHLLSQISGSAIWSCVVKRLECAEGEGKRRQPPLGVS